MGREMLSLVISNGEATAAREQSEPVHSDSKEVPSEQKLSFVIIGAQHAREWIATSASLYLAHALVSDLSEPYSLSRLLNVFDFYIIPVPNPDGYEYTWEKDRFWYKTRQQVSPKSDCVGIDMNRNWGYKWKA
ncbi:putative metallocarboxypeptidase, partial [Termitomyces sp. T112]